MTGDDWEPGPDDLSRADLAELAHLPWSDLADVLDEWLHRNHGVLSSSHNVGMFLDLLAERGWEIARRPVLPPIADMLPPATD